jgi:uncharacterized membrane protein YhaH (DUF805 family)
LPLVVWQGVTDWPVVITLFSALAVLFVHALMGSRRSHTRAWPALLLSGLAVILATRVMSSVLFVQALVCLMCGSWFAYPAMMRYPWRVYAFMLATGLLPLALEIAGVIPSTWTIGDGSITETSLALRLSGSSTIVLLVASTAATISIAALVGRRLAEARRTAQQKVEIQAWHLSKLVGR